MKRLGAAFAVLWLAVLAQGETEATMADVRRLTVAVALLDYPIDQAKVRDALGLPSGVTPSFGSGDQRGTYWMWPLVRRQDGGSYYALKVFYSNDTKETTGRIPSITAIEVIFFSASGGEFVADPNSYPLTEVPRLKAMMKKSGLTPREFTMDGKLAEHLQEARLEAARERKAAVEKKAQAPD